LKLAPVRPAGESEDRWIMSQTEEQWSGLTAKVKAALEREGIK
jgi:hypothetical protein